MKVSLVVPCYNEEENIALFAKTAEEAMAGMDYEIIFINDGSKDNTIGELKACGSQACKHYRCGFFS